MIQEQFAALQAGTRTQEGRKDLFLRDTRLLIGELPWGGIGEFLHSKIAFHRSAPSSFALVMMDLPC